MPLFILAYIAGWFVSILMLSVIIIFSIPPLFLRFYSGSPTRRPEARKRNILIAGEGAPGLSIAQAAAKQNNPLLRVAGFVTKRRDVNEGTSTGRKILGTIDQLEEIIKAYEIKEVVIAEDEEDLDFIFGTAERAKKLGAKVRVLSKHLAIIEKKVKLKKYFDKRCVELSGQPEDRLTVALKRAGDLVIASIALIILLPFMLIISLLIKLTSPGKIIFKQLRVGRNGKQFRMYKFRTMHSLESEDERRKEMMLEFMKHDTCASGGDTKIIDESRVTAIGKLLRKTSLDEFPQLINVIKGDMSLVGPRPCVPYEYENYEPWQKKRVCVLPGCTGIWQVSGRSSVSFKDSVILDLYYVHNISLLMDLAILIKTIPVLLFSRGGK
ncbi:MAG TPA: exopolysaccharide biosynthesis polyprenyl glycosylphosphotransferase [Ignavibacteriales bacterium]|nr:exopolysaccharide biosynthesis polyprenyl glycosylphosphotransferase [Ignavibacteriales bacterium]